LKDYSTCTFYPELGCSIYLRNVLIVLHTCLCVVTCLNGGSSRRIREVFIIFDMRFSSFICHISTLGVKVIFSSAISTDGIKTVCCLAKTEEDPVDCEDRDHCSDEERKVRRL